MDSAIKLQKQETQAFGIVIEYTNLSGLSEEITDHLLPYIAEGIEGLTGTGDKISASIIITKTD